MQIIPHSKELVELSRMTPKSTRSDFIWPSYRPLKFENFRGQKFDYANNSSFERARRAELNNTKITVIGQD
uniref:Uncharacterized protein n=1 Tax=Meloidogyne enterolobii TaxID=390850 RepID=A0A6V7VQC1_MELEN|nr:unnamed protein product [Meloidogyne enterolobii]